ncbi:cytochrome d ubiquinol oxidase subunit II [Macrococcus equipercicus]|uniref:Cytochrome d ubiquinol oxidase subunit II n=1 Tax=Macrococcus equipercicus TaxID=69967 RepID=A0A9Q9BWC4_9STAP|nr:cytochrome d ubiquinol oxidase subunit II [Macrococcus equipercicus]UTH14522.1 cytochrome d ubiquinol oxidase subunit II [Macrococcus equipercicus]
MDYQHIGITVLWTFLYGYIIIGAIDFGAGFFMLYAKITKQDHMISSLVSRYLNPVWEVTNVFLVFFFVGIVGFFPDTAYYFGSTLLIPGTVALILLAIRGGFYAFETYGKDSKFAWIFLYGMTGLLIPAAFSTVLTISEGGFIEKTDKGVMLNWLELLMSPYSWAVVFLAIISVLYISSGFLTYYAHKAGDTAAYRLMRQWFLIWAGPMLIICQFVFLSLRQHNAQHFNTALTHYWWLFALSIVFFLAALILILLKRNHGVAFIMIMIQFALAFFGYGLSKLPYILYPYVNINKAVVNDNMAIALVIVFILGLLLLVPSLLLLLRLFIFDADYVKGNKK